MSRSSSIIYHRPMSMTKREVRAALGYTMDKELAEFFGLGKSTISQWRENKPIPIVRQWQLRALRPDLFPAERRTRT